MSSKTSRLRFISKHQVEQLHIFNAYHSVIIYADGDPRPDAERVANLVASVFTERSSVAPSRSQEDVCKIIRGLLDEVRVRIMLVRIKDTEHCRGILIRARCYGLSLLT